VGNDARKVKVFGVTETNRSRLRKILILTAIGMNMAALWDVAP
jgi:hypothetical protein